jgi:hypothetical protein
MLPGSGSLESDIGGVSDLVGPQRGSLGLGMVEAMTVIRINKNLLSVDTSNITPLDDKNWEQKIPKRDWLCDEVASDFLAGGFEEQDKVEYENDSTDSDDEDSL